MMHRLKRIRWLLALTFFLPVMLAFLDFNEFFTAGTVHRVAQWQIFPALVALLSLSGTAIIVLLVWFLLTLLLGRVYCSTFCPLGIWMDITLRVRSLFVSKKRRKRPFTYHYKPNFLHYGILATTVVALLLGISGFAGLFDPYSLFGRIMSGLVRPVMILFYNAVAGGAAHFHYYLLKPVEFQGIPAALLIISGAIFIFITVLTFLRGRYFCNSICPVGALLRFPARYSHFRIQFEPADCTACGLCSTGCKAGCIDHSTHHVEHDACVVCFNCLENCPRGGIKYAPVSKSQRVPVTDTACESRRNFLTLVAFGSLALWERALAQQKKIVVTVMNKIKIHRKLAIAPPGSQNLYHFMSACISCYLCVNNCPGQVLQPSLLEYGISGLLLPHMNNRIGFCNYKCNRCGEVCPTGAIQPVPLKEKQLIQIGTARFVRDNCIVVLQKTECGACSEHCPTKAVKMIPEKGLHIPEITPSLCIGCGACEYACPSLPHKSIYVEGKQWHGVARRPEEKKLPEVDPTEDFPF